MKLFCLDLTATQIAAVSGLNINTVDKYLLGIRQRIAEYCESESPFKGDIEVDESFFGARRVKGKRGRGAYGKTIVFGLFKRNGTVYTEIVPDCSRRSLQRAIRGHVALDSVIYSEMVGEVITDWWMSVMASIFVLTMVMMSLFGARVTSMGLKGFGDWLKHV